MYVYETKEDDDYVMRIAKCKNCFNADMIRLGDKYICGHCGTEYKKED